MKIKRTANAGVLIETGGMRFLIDGVCKKILNYEKTPQYIKDELCAQFPDVVMFTHYHDDHYDKEFSLSYTQKNTPVRLRAGVCPLWQNGERKNKGSANTSYRQSRYCTRKLYSAG